MNRWMRRGLGAACALLASAGAAVLLGVHLAERKMQRTLAVPVAPLTVAPGPALLQRGGYLFASRGCADCHGKDGAGRTFAQDGQGLQLAGPNISPGPGSVVVNYTDADWTRTVRHGVKPDGRPVLVMPSEDYNRLTDADVGALVAYVRSLPPVPGGGAVLQMPLPMRVLYGFGMIQDAAGKIDHALPPAQPVPEGVTPEHGRYVANMCIGCHGPQLAGGKIPGGPPDWPAASRLLPGPGSAMPRYADAEALRAMFRSGRRPDGTAVQVMPFESLRELSEVDVRALFLYLKTLPAPAASAAAPGAAGGRA